MSDKPTRCRHRNVWVFASRTAQMLWCYQCGAIRNGDGWVRPTGPGGPNPAMATNVKSEAK